ncbi:uncharacterized protein (DUF1800 family) [Rhodobacter viridis]|uniref:Uncharacterized protein (DUF1800 family) n=1 Tax=Rhodobacter viridis TaxID=1054202 RepID=A0A318U8L5_9RHOB|nr:DUF1800 domain-containing protein [Rhodobacter viridis]PYF11215.1 uncharacterized protein (DUF1800 family) [Rhodobacter viridis]
MEFSQLAQVRFGFGPAPGKPAPADAGAMLETLAGPDVLASRWPGLSTEDALAAARDFRAAKKTAKHASKADAEATQAAFTAQKQRMTTILLQNLQVSLARAVEAPDGFRERLWAFWRDHFTVMAKRRQDVGLSCAHGEALRPHIAGNFKTLLRVAETHPMMLIYLDQSYSIGPNSRRAQKRPGLGLNENLAREAMELHTLGVGGHYSQTDVRQLAELFTGMQADSGEDFAFAPNLAEPGTETVLGKTFGGDPAKLEDIYAVLDTLALHPDTARHLASKLAVHFVGPAPDPALVTAMAEAYSRSGGELMPVYKVLLTHPGALTPQFAKVRQPFDYVATGLRALGVDGDAVRARKIKEIRNTAFAPMRQMGQPWLATNGPDGWPEEDEEWISPQQLAARINWAMRAPLLYGAAPADPMAFAEAALGPRLSPALAQAVPRSETKAEAVALVLASAEFMRR